MAYIVTRMPSTGSVTNVTRSADTVEEVRARWADRDCVQVYSDEEFDRLPHCSECGSLRGDPRCCYCPRP